MIYFYNKFNSEIYIHSFIYKLLKFLHLNNEKSLRELIRISYFLEKQFKTYFVLYYGQNAMASACARAR